MCAAHFVESTREKKEYFNRRSLFREIDINLRKYFRELVEGNLQQNWYLLFNEIVAHISRRLIANVKNVYTTIYKWVISPNLLGTFLPLRIRNDRKECIYVWNAKKFSVKN